MLNPFNPLIDQITTTIVDWWHAHPVQGLLAAGLLAAVITAAAIALTVAENRRRDDELLDRLGSATPDIDTNDELANTLLAGRNAIESAPIPNLVDTDTAVATIRSGAA